VAACAHNAHFVISGMDGCFHVCFGPQCESLDSKRRAQDSANSRGASVVENHSAFIDVAPHAKLLLTWRHTRDPSLRLKNGSARDDSNTHRQSEGRLHRRAALGLDGSETRPHTNPFPHEPVSTRTLKKEKRQGRSLPLTRTNVALLAAVDRLFQFGPGGGFCYFAGRNLECGSGLRVAPVAGFSLRDGESAEGDQRYPVSFF